MYMSISGSTILSRTELLDTLFTPYHDAVEIGFLEDENAWRYFLRLVEERGPVRWGLHFPRLGCYKPIQNELVAADPEVRERLRSVLVADSKKVSDAGGEYVLVHFPFFPTADLPLAALQDRIKRGIDIIHGVAAKSDLPVVVEFKLGRNLDTGGLRYVIEMADELLDALVGIGCCLDVGDWSLASLRLSDAKKVFDQWMERATHLHLHGVAVLEDNRYYWTPVTPDVKLPGEGWDLAAIVTDCAERAGRWAVCEHTPHFADDERAIAEGYRWLRQLLSG